MAELTNILIPLFIGLVFLFIGSKSIAKRKTLIINGTETDGVIFGFKTSSDSDIYGKYPIIRFVTKEGQWITETSDYGSLPFLLKTGQQVKVIYNPENPKEFIYKTSYDFSKIGYIIIVTGIIFLIIGIWLAYKYLTKQD